MEVAVHTAPSRPGQTDGMQQSPQASAAEGEVMTDEDMTLISIGFFLSMAILVVQSGFWIVPLAFVIAWWFWDQAGSGRF